MNEIFTTLEYFNDTVLWGYLGLGLIFTSGLYLSFKARFSQFFKFHKVIRHFIYCAQGAKNHELHDEGVSPIRVFFASIGGCIGIGNVTGVVLGVQIGGPGALVWVLTIAVLGSIIKYSEIYLGVKYRRPGRKSGFDGGPMYFLQKAFPNAKWVASVMAVFLCIYGIEIYMFSVIKSSLVTNFNLNEWVVILILLSLTLITVAGGVQRVGTLSSYLIPFFVIIYLSMTIYVLAANIEQIPSLIKIVLKSAFEGHAPIGGFAGSTALIALSKGFSSAAYSGDVGIGYASIVNSETRFMDPKHQAIFAILAIFLDTYVVCTCTILLVLMTGVWAQPIDSTIMVQEALGQYFPYMNYFMPAFLFILAFSTIATYMIAGMKCASFLSPKFGTKVYIVYGIIAFLFFSFYEAKYAFLIMNISGGFLMLINIAGILKLRNEIDYKF
jgi:AGCS family alanine or glycine:cation symporter